jgi:hemoglobin
MSEAELSLYDRLGGRPGVDGVIADLYDRIMGDDALAPFFDGVDVERVQRHQIDLVITAVGGPSTFTGRSLRDAHAGLQIEQLHVDLVIAHLSASLERGGVAPDDVASLIAVVERLWTAQFWTA